MFLWDYGTLKIYEVLLWKPFSYCRNILKLNNDIMRYNKLAKRVTKGASVSFEMCMLPLIYPHYLCGQFYL